MEQQGSLPLQCGDMLKQARLKADLTLDDVANRLCLKPDAIAQMECDDFSFATNLAFARGYVRGYANLLRLPVEEVVAAFEALEWQGATGVDLQRLAKSKLVFSKNGGQGKVNHLFARKWVGKRGVLSLVVVLVVAVLFAWFWLQRSSQDAASSLANDSMSAAGQVQVTPVPITSAVSTPVAKPLPPRAMKKVQPKPQAPVKPIVKASATPKNSGEISDFRIIKVKNHD